MAANLSGPGRHVDCATMRRRYRVKNLLPVESRSVPNPHRSPVGSELSGIPIRVYPLSRRCVVCRMQRAIEPQEPQQVMRSLYMLWLGSLRAALSIQPTLAHKVKPF